MKRIACAAAMVALVVGCSGVRDATPTVTVTATVETTVETTVRVTTTATATVTAEPVSAESVPPDGESVEASDEELYLEELGDRVISESFVIQRGQEVCSQYEDQGDAAAQARFIINEAVFTYGRYLALRHLCPDISEAAALAESGFDDGTYDIGEGEEDVAPGRYATGRAEDCYWERVSGDGRTLANDFVSLAPDGVTVSILATDGGFVSTGCGPWLPA